MVDFDFIEDNLNLFFSDGVYRIVVIPKADSDRDAGSLDREISSEKHALESSNNDFTSE